MTSSNPLLVHPSRAFLHYRSHTRVGAALLHALAALHPDDLTNHQTELVLRAFDLEIRRHLRLCSIRLQLCPARVKAFNQCETSQGKAGAFLLQKVVVFQMVAFKEVERTARRRKFFQVPGTKPGQSRSTATGLNSKLNGRQNCVQIRLGYCDSLLILSYHPFISFGHATARPALIGNSFYHTAEPVLLGVVPSPYETLYVRVQDHDVRLVKQRKHQLKMDERRAELQKLAEERTRKRREAAEEDKLKRRKEEESHRKAVEHKKSIANVWLTAVKVQKRAQKEVQSAGWVVSQSIKAPKEKTKGCAVRVSLPQKLGKRSKKSSS